ncbi:MAG: molybdopterin-dependent oxidoreductase, partial [Dehalococcoidia bacterium]|nr:molybdopterin-dependent oxidoreductase [Dehalococcoidia bacterium]
MSSNGSTGSNGHYILGKPLPRIEGPDKVTGQTVYAADILTPDMLHAKVLRSPHAHARILSIDTSAAKALPGVHAVITAADLPPADRDESIRSHVVFADKEALFQGQPIAAVAAEAVDIAEEALELIKVEYELLPPVLDVEEAVKDDALPTRAPLAEIDLNEAGGHITVELDEEEKPAEAKRSPNIVNRLAFKRGDVEQGFANADVIVEGRWDAKMVHQAYLEPQACVAHWDPAGRLTIWSATQGQFFQRAEIARILGLQLGQVRYISTEVGGGFGAKVPPLIQPLVGLLAMKTRRPVRLVLTRKEDLMVSVPAPRSVVVAKLGATKDGKLTTFKATVLFDAGAFPSGPVVGASMMIAACYTFDHLDVEGLEVLTNKVSCGAYRAPGMPEVTFAIEQMVDEVARRL